MFVYTVEFVDGNDNQSTHFVYATEEVATEAAIDEMELYLSNRCFDDPDRPEYYNLYCEIHDLVVNRDYAGALEKYNDLPEATNDYENHTYIFVHSKEVHTSHKASSCSVKCDEPHKAETVIKKDDRACRCCGRMNTYPVETTCWWCGTVLGKIRK
jgi:hypothetical protein